MTPATTAPAPGSMTVPFLFGWEVVLVGLVLVVVVAVAFIAFGALRAGRGDRTEWQAWLEARSSTRPDLATDGNDRSAPLR